MIHEIKILPDYFDAAICGAKRFELRKYVLKDCPEYGLEKGYCVFGW